MTTDDGSWRVERVAALPGWTSGIAVASSGRVFVSAPQVDQPAPQPTVAEIVDGAARAFPTGAAEAFTSVQGLRAGPNNTLYALDSGVRALSGTDFTRAALWVIDVESGNVVRRYDFPAGVLLPSTYLNDLAVDIAGSAAYIVDAGGEEPHGLILLDLTTGIATRVLHNHPTVRAAESPTPGGITAAGQPLFVRDEGGRPTPVVVGATGITLAEHDRTLYWNRADELFSTATANLAQLTGNALDQAITTWPVRRFASEGLDQDAEGNVLLTDLANNGVQRLDTTTGTCELLAADPDISWPDGVAAAPDGSIFVTSSQIHHSAMFNNDDQRNPPFGVFRLTPRNKVPR